MVLRSCFCHAIGWFSVYECVDGVNLSRYLYEHMSMHIYRYAGRERPLDFVFVRFDPENETLKLTFRDHTTHTIHGRTGCRRRRMSQGAREITNRIIVRHRICILLYIIYVMCFNLDFSLLLLLSYMGCGLGTLVISIYHLYLQLVLLAAGDAINDSERAPPDPFISRPDSDAWFLVSEPLNDQSEQKKIMPQILKNIKNNNTITALLTRKRKENRFQPSSING